MKKKKMIAVAATAVFLCGISGIAWEFTMQGRNVPGAEQGTQTEEDTFGTADMRTEEDTFGTEQGTQTGEDTFGTSQDTQTEEDTFTAPKQDAGKLYVVADDYGDVYDLLKEQNSYTVWDRVYAFAGGAREETVTEDAAAADGAANMSSVSKCGNTESYSGTNLQTEGVDESDIIKTDGSYIYTVNNDTVKITDIRGKNMKAAGNITISAEGASDQVLEMYVDGDILNLIVQRERTALKQQADETAEDVYYMDMAVETEVLTYDISDKADPVLKGSVAQDGYYKTSRKIGGVIYLFTTKYMQQPDLTRREAVSGKAAEEWIPLVNGEAVAADCIYVPECGEMGLVISSVNVKNPDGIVDNVLIINDYVEIYVSTEAFYLYGSDYTGSSLKTQIAKFSLEQGEIQAVGAAQAAGEVRDTFAVNEYEGKLRLLTTDWSGEDENALYLFDENLELTGKLTGIAEGEQIYAARYFKDMAYFVTYRNTDPLFAADLSDAKNPRILSELKITGFSEYLHFWGEDKLAGIGYETDPDSGATEGIKLTMFDISDPADLKTLDTFVIKNMDSSPALYDYKCVLADAGENMLGFAAECYGSQGVQNSYLLFTWEDGEFKNLLTGDLGTYAENGINIGDYRGLYAGGYFYLASPESILCYDRENGYKLEQELEL